MTSSIYNSIATSTRTLGILLDPEKMDDAEVLAFAKAISLKITALKSRLSLGQIILLVGGSTMEDVDFQSWITNLKKQVALPTLIFPGSHHQVAADADALLFLNLISGRNPEYLIEQQVKAAAKIAAINIEVIPTAYMLLDGGKETAVSRVSQTLPMDQNDVTLISNTALAGQFMGNKLVYLEAGSGANKPVKTALVRELHQQLHIPIIVGGGLRTHQAIEDRFNAGAKMVVVGTAIEENLDWI
jgi:putative glycerol-1-phosphate prenyltransferase